jgi:GNAT superfamily N-acetyltransferase
VPVSPPAESVAAVRAFNRFYTRWVGALDEGLLRTRHSLPEARVLFELWGSDSTEVSRRLLAGLESQGLVSRERSAADARRQVVSLTKAGRASAQDLDSRSAAQVGARLESLDPGGRARLEGAMGTIRRVLEPDGSAPPPVVIRAPAPGDYGWIVERHGALYAEEFGWDESFEVLVARIVADFAASRDPEREAGFIAELGGERAGSVLCARKSKRVAQLRMLIVEPHARRMGIGGRLVEECVDFARRAGYREITLWTHDVLESAHRIYERAGFALVDSEPHHSWGHDLVGQNWSRPL